MSEDIVPTGQNISSEEYWEWRHASAVLEASKQASLLGNKSVLVVELESKLKKYEHIAAKQKANLLMQSHSTEKETYQNLVKKLADKYGVAADKLVIDDETLEISQVEEI